MNSAAKDMTSGSPTGLIIKFAIPMLFGNLVQQLYNMVDTIIVGQCLGTDALAAVGSTGSLNFLILGFVMGITNGIAVIAAQRFGAKDMEGLKRSVAMSIMLSTGLVILMTSLSVAFTKPLLRLTNTPETIIDEAYSYIVVIFMGIFAVVLYNMISCQLRALGDSRTPLVFLFICSLINIGLDLLFITVFGWGVAGAAWATVLSQLLSGILCFIYVVVKYPALHVRRKDFHWNTKFAWEHLRIGIPMAFQFSITAIGCVILQGALNLFGEDKIASFSTAQKVEQLVTGPASTFGVTMANYAGQNLGARRIDRIKDGVRKCTMMTLAASVLSFLIIQLLSKYMLQLFDIQPGTEIMADALYYLKLSSCFYPFLNMIFIYRNVLQGIGRSFMPLMAGVFELIARTVSAYTLPNIIGFSGICLAGIIAWIAASVPLGIAYVLIIRKLSNSYGFGHKKIKS